MKLLKTVLSVMFIGIFLNAAETKDAKVLLTNLVNSAFAEAKKTKSYISLAAQNKMLSQEIAKDAVKIVTKIDDKRARKDILKHAERFNKTINAFLNGNEHIKPLENSLARKQAQEIMQYWKPVYDAAKKLANSKKVDIDSFVYIYRHNEPLLGMSHKLTQTLKSQLKFKTTFSPIIEHTLKFLDRERFLIPKMLKEKFLIFRKIDVKRNKVRLHGSFILFEHTLYGLLNGDKKRGLVPVSNKKIRSKLLELKKEWEKVKDLYKFKRKNLTKEDMIKLNSNNDKMLKITNDLVHLVEKSLGI